MTKLGRRSAVFALLSLPLGYYKAFAARAGWLTVDLGQWTGVEVRYKGKTQVFTAEDIWEALQEEQ